MFRVSNLSKFARSIAAGLLSLGVSAAATSSASAQYQPQIPGQVPAGWNNTIGQTLSPQTLVNFLRSMNLEVEVVPGANGNAVYKVPFTTQQFKGKVEVSLSGDNTRLWFVISLGQVAPAANTQVLRQLMEQNDQTASIFSITSEGYLLLKRNIDNLQVTPERFKAEVARMLNTLDETRGCWQVATAPAQNNPAAGQNGLPGTPAGYPGQNTYPGYPGSQTGYPTNGQNGNGQHGQPSIPGGRMSQPATGDVGFDGQIGR